MNPRLTAKPLAIHSRGDGPRVHVWKLREVEVKDAGPDDIIEVHIVEHTLPSQPEPIRVKGSNKRSTNFPGGVVQVKRIAGTNFLTVLGHCEAR